MNLIRNLHNWAGLKSIIMVVSTRIIDGKESKDTRYYLKQEKTAKGGVHAKQLQAAWNDDYLLKILAAAN